MNPAITAAPVSLLAYPSPTLPTPPLDSLPASVYIARLDDLARLTVRLLHTVPVEHLSYKERKRLRRTVSKLLAGVSFSRGIRLQCRRGPDHAASDRYRTARPSGGAAADGRARQG
jgi:hypothetical protein